MPSIRNIGQQVSAPGPVDYAMERPSTAFAQLQREAKEAGGILDQIAQEDAAVEGLKALSDFDTASDARALELQKTAKTPDGFGKAWAGDWDQRAQQLIDATGNERVASFLQQRLLAGRERAHAPGYAWEASQKEALQATQFDQSVGQMAAGITSDHTRFAEALANVDATLKAGGFEPAKREALWVAASRQLARSYVAGLPPAEGLRQLQAGELDNYIDPDNKVALINQLEAKQRGDEAAARVETNRAQTLAALQFATQVNAYGNGQAERPALTPEVRASIGDENALRAEMSLSDADAKIGKAQAGMAKVTTALALGQRLDQSDAKDRDAVDQHFMQTFVPTLQQVPPEQRVDAIMGQINRYGVVPGSFASQMVTIPLATGSPDQKAQAAEVYARLAQEQPAFAGSNDISDVTRRTAILINNYREAGMSAEDAARAADADLKIEKKQGKEIGAEYQDRIKPTSVGGPSRSQEFLQNAFSEGWFSATPAMQGGVVSAFDNLAAHEYATNGGNLDLAQKAALDKLKSQYGVSRVNGSPIIMRHAPELFYSIPGLEPSQNSIWIKQQAVADLNRNSAAPIAPENIQIIPYAVATGRNMTGPDGKPAYALTVVGPDGIPYPQMDYTPGSPNYGKPLAWVPDTEKETAIFNSASELRNQFNLEVARFNRDTPNLTMQQREQRRKEILQKYDLNPLYRDRLEWLAPFVKPKQERRSEADPLENATGQGGPAASDQEAVPADQTAFDWDSFADGVNSLELRGDRYNYTRGTDLQGSDSTAVGPFQLTRSTFNQLRRSHADLPEEWPPTGPVQEKAFKYLTQANQSALRSLGIEVTPVTTYMAHFLGPGGAKALMNAKPNTTVADALKGVYSDKLYEKIIRDHSWFRSSTVDDEVNRIGKAFVSPPPANAEGPDDAEMWTPRFEGDVPAGVGSTAPTSTRSIDQAVTIAQSMQRTYGRMSADVREMHARRVDSQRIMQGDTRKLYERLHAASTEHDRAYLIAELTDRARSAKRTERRQILNELDKHLADASLKEKLLIMSVHLMDDAEAGANSFAGLFR